MSTAPPPAKIRYSGLLRSVHKYHVMLGEEIIGQFSNLPLATDTAHAHRGSLVLDLSTKPPKVVYRGGRLVEKP